MNQNHQYTCVMLECVSILQIGCLFVFSICGARNATSRSPTTTAFTNFCLIDKYAFFFFGGVLLIKRHRWFLSPGSFHSYLLVTFIALQGSTSSGVLSAVACHSEHIVSTHELISELNRSRTAEGPTTHYFKPPESSVSLVGLEEKDNSLPF